LRLPAPARSSPHFTPGCRETSDNWDAEIAEDVGSECQKYGAVLHVFVDRNSRGFVYVVGGGARLHACWERQRHDGMGGEGGARAACGASISRA
jgi:hypothetical protein